MTGGNDIDSLNFSIVLDSKKFEDELKRVEGIAKKFEEAVTKSLTVTNLLDMAQSKGTKEKVRSQKEVVLLTRQELEAKKAAGEITDKELKQLNALIRAEKGVLEEKKKQLDIEKKELDIKAKQEKMANGHVAAENQVGEAIRLNSDQFTKQTRVMKELVSYAAQFVSVFGAANLVRNMIRITGEFEAQHTALRAILQDTAAADQIFNQLQVLAVKSPFTFQNLTAYAKQLTAFSVPINEVYETTKKLADISAGLGVDMGRIILAYGQVRSAEFLRGQEVRQFTEAGIPILKELADQFREIEGYAVSVGEVFDRISARQVPFAIVEEAFNRMTSAGGKFYNMQEVLAETVKGKISNLQDAWEIMLSRIGDEHSGTIKGIITYVTNLLSNYERLISIFGTIIKTVGLYQAGLLALNAVTKASNAISTIRNSIELLHSKQLKLITILLPTQNALEKISIANKEKELAVTTALNFARKAGVAILSALRALAWTGIQAWKRSREESNKSANIINTALEKMNASMVDFNIGASRVEEAFKKMKAAGGDAREETDEFHRSVDELKKQFPKFINDNVKLAETIDDLGKYWARAREEMNQYYADEARESAYTDFKQNRDEAVGNISKDVTDYITRFYKNKDQLVGKNIASTVWRYVIGDIDETEILPDLESVSKYWNKRFGVRSTSTDEILKHLKKFVKDYKEVIDEYSDARELFDQKLAQSTLRTTRDNFNAYLLNSPIYGGNRYRWKLKNGDEYRLYEEWDEATKKSIIESWAKNYDKFDLAVGINESIEDWAERQRKRLKELDSKYQYSLVAEIIRDAFDQFGIVEDPNKLNEWQQAVQDKVDNFGDVIRGALEKMGMGEEEIEAFVNEHQGHAASKVNIDSKTQLTEVIEKWTESLDADQKALKMMPQMYTGLQNDAYANLWLNQLLYQTISEALYGPGIKDFGGNTKDAEQERKERERKWKEYKSNRISELKQEFQDLKDLKSHYDALKDLKFDDTQIEQLFTSFYGKGIPKGGFNAAFEDVAKGLEKYNEKNAAQDVRNFASGKDLTEYTAKIKAAREAQDKWRESLEDLAASTKRLNLEGFSAELDKIIVDTDSKNRKLRTDWNQRERELEKEKDGWIADYRVSNEKATAEEAEKAWTDYFESQKNAAKKNIDELIAYNNKVAQEQINKKADEWIKTILEQNNIDLSDMGDKSLAQVNTLIDRMQALVSDEALAKLIPAELLEDAKLINASFTELLSSVKKIANTKLGDLRVEKMKKVVAGVSTLMSTLGINTDTKAVSEAYSTLSQSLIEVANAQDQVDKSQEKYDVARKTGDLSKEAAAYLDLSVAQGQLKQKTDAATEAQNQFNIALAVAATGAFASGLQKVGDAIKRIGDASEDANLSAVGDAVARISQNVNAAAAGYSAAAASGAGAYAWIGAVAGGVADIIGQIAEAVEVQKQMMTEYEKNLKEYKNAYRASLLEMSEFTDMFGEQISKSARDAYDKMITAAKQAQESFSKLKSSQVVIEHKAALENGKTLYGDLTGLYPGLFDKDGHLNIDLANSVIKALPKGGTSRDWNEELRTELQNAILLEEAWQNAKEALDGYITDFTGDWASSLADAMWDAVASGEDAWDEWHRVASDAISDIGKQMLAEMIQTAWLGKYEKELEEAFSSGESPDEIWKNVADVAMRMFDDVDSNYDKYLQITQDWQNKMLDAGYTLNGGGSSNSVGSGIKSITEDTANLLASYINAIRDDVSNIRKMQENAWPEIKSFVAAVPSLSEYLSQVAANTFDTAESNRQILSTIEDVIGSPGSTGQVVRVELN